MSSSKISVVIPVFNEEQIIEKLATEIEKYIDDPLEFVFINDGSSDNTLESAEARGFFLSSPFFE